MKTSRIISRLILILTLLISVGVIGFAVYYSQPNSHEAWAVIAASLAVVAAVIAAWTGQRAIEIQEDAQQPFPYPTIDATSRYSLLQLRLKNTGGTPAHNIRLVWDKPLLNSKGEAVKFIKQEEVSEVPVLLPKESVSVLIDEANHFFETISNANYTGWVQFQDASGRERKHKFFLSIEAYRNRLYYDQEEPKTNYQLQKIPEKLDKLAKELEAIREQLIGNENTDQDTKSTLTKMLDFLRKI